MSEAVPYAIEIDRSLCTGSGLCIVYAPGTFEHDDEVTAVVADPAGDPLDDIRVATEACPTGAIHIVDQVTAHGS